jgi:hypothetical protein
MSEEHLNEQLEDKTPVPLSQSLGFGAGTFLAVGAIDLLAHLGPTGLVVGGIAAYVAGKHGPELASQVREAFPSRESVQPGEERPRRNGGRSLIDRALGRFPVEQEETEQDAESSASGDEGAASQPEDDAAFAQAAAQKDVPGVARLTIDQIVRHVEPNSYKIYIGRSLSRPGNPAISISFYKRHIKLIGASQYGKSSMAAALLEIITRTHDPQHVLVALLDLEDQTSKLFATLPHRAQVTISGKPVVLHARNPEQVLEYLGYLIQIMEYRYTLSKTEILQRPIILVYLEEFIALKDYFKSYIDAVQKDEKEQAKRDYADLVFRIKELARRGLKVHVQLLMCAQCDYRDEDLQEALINVTAGMSFCVRVTAAQAAGFYQTELLARNAKEDKKGQAVVEMPDCKDLALVPQYDLEQQLIALEQAELAEAKRQGKGTGRASDSCPPGFPPTDGCVDQPLPAEEQQRAYIPRQQPLPEQMAYIPRWQPLPEQQAFPQQQGRQQWAAAPNRDLREIRREEAAEHLPDLEQDVVPIPSQQRSLRHHQEKYAKAIAVWHELEEKQSATMRDFAAAMNLNEARAYKLLCEMERLQLIHWERKKKKAR